MASSAPYSQPLAAALGGSEPLADLLKRLRESQARFAVIRPLLPEALVGTLTPGPLDDTAWVLLAANPSSAAKLRQRLPELQAALLAAGWEGPPLKVRVRSIV